MLESRYDTVTICANGHIVDGMSRCDVCGAPALDRCEDCGELLTLSGLPAYCPNCGYPYPWTQARIERAQELADGITVLSGIERELLKESIEELVGDGPRAPVAILRFKRLATRAGMVGAFREILADVVSEAVKQAIWG